MAPAKGLPGPIKKQVERLGFASIEGTEGWQARAASSGAAFWCRGDDKLRGLRFVAPRPRACAIAGRRWTVLGQTPTSLAILEVSHGPSFNVRFLARLESILAPGSRSLENLLKNLSEDEEISAAPTSGGVTLSPTLESDVLWSLADQGRLNAAPRGIASEWVAELRLLRVHGAGVHTEGIAPFEHLAEIDERFAALEALMFHGVGLNDLTPLRRLPRLRRLMLNTCEIAAPEQLAELTSLTDLHLPGCRLPEEKLGFLREMRSLTSCTVAGNLLTSASRPLVAALPPGLADVDFDVTDRLLQAGIVTGALVPQIVPASSVAYFPLEGAIWSAINIQRSAPIPALATLRNGGRLSCMPQTLQTWPESRPFDPQAALRLSAGTKGIQKAALTSQQGTVSIFVDVVLDPKGTADGKGGPIGWFDHDFWESVDGAIEALSRVSYHSSFAAAASASAKALGIEGEHRFDLLFDHRYGAKPGRMKTGWFLGAFAFSRKA